MLVATISPVIAPFFLQVTLWLSFSTFVVANSRHLLPKRKMLASKLGDDDQGETLTEIAPGQIGRVFYEGNS